MMHPVSQDDSNSVVGANGSGQIIANIVAIHADELASLWTTRRVLLRAPHVGLSVMSALDDRIAAHLDGCLVAGTAGLQMLQARFIETETATAFALAVVALEGHDQRVFDAVVCVSEMASKCISGTA